MSKSVLPKKLRDPFFQIWDIGRYGEYTLQQIADLQHCVSMVQATIDHCLKYNQFKDISKLDGEFIKNQKKRIVEERYTGDAGVRDLEGLVEDPDYALLTTSK